MYSKLAFFVVSALALGAVAGDAPAPPPPAGPITTSQCDVGTLNCCHSVQSADSHAVQTLASHLGIALGDLTGQIGITCTAILGGNSCSAQTACCSGNNFHGTLVAGCNPVHIGA